MNENMQEIKDSIKEIIDFNRAKENFNVQEFSKLNFTVKEQKDKLKMTQSDISHFNAVMNNSMDEIK